MTSGTLSIQTCDDEHGCEEWMPDYYAMGVSGWRSFLGGWFFDSRTDRAYCPDHTDQAKEES